MTEPDPKPTGGTFTLHMGGHTSSPIPYDADIDVLRAAVEDITSRPPRTMVTSIGGWCAPSEALYDFGTLPDIGIPWGGNPYPSGPITPAPPPTLRERWRATRQRLAAVRRAARAAWAQPDGYWEED